MMDQKIKSLFRELSILLSQKQSLQGNARVQKERIAYRNAELSVDEVFDQLASDLITIYFPPRSK